MSSCTRAKCAAMPLDLRTELTDSIDRNVAERSGAGGQVNGGLADQQDPCRLGSTTPHSTAQP